jgi:sec-independent protein translocase protein TatA
MQREPQMMPSTGEMLIILALFVLFFGVDKLPKIARSLGMAKGEFQQGLTDSHTEITEADLERGGRTEAAAITEAAEEVDVEVEGKSVAEVEAELEEE